MSTTRPKRDGDGDDVDDDDDDDDDDDASQSSKKNRLERYSRLCRDEVIARGGGRSLPSVEIKCDFDYVLHLSANKIDRAIKTVPGVVSDVAMTLPNKIREKISGKENEATKVEPFRVLKDVDCCFKAGSMTLVLAPPGQENEFAESNRASFTEQSSVQRERNHVFQDDGGGVAEREGHRRQSGCDVRDATGRTFTFFDGERDDEVFARKFYSNADE